MNSMTIVFFVASAIAFVASAPQIQTNTHIPVVERYEDVDARGQYSLRYISGDGSIVTELGRLVPTNDGTDYVLVKEGSYTYTGPEGKRITLNYVADANGFRPQGEHLPVSVV